LLKETVVFKDAIYAKAEGKKIADVKEGMLIEQFAKNNKISLLWLFPFDKQIAEPDMNGESPIKYANKSKGIDSIRQLGEKVIQRTT
jgi:nitrogenase subunit NifH